MSDQTSRHERADAANDSALSAPNTAEVDISQLSRWGVRWRQLPLFLALVLLWLFLWDAVSVLSITTGVVLALVVMRALYLPPVLFSGRFNPWRGLLLGLRMIYDVVVASIQVAFASINPWWSSTSAILAVQLHTRSDVVTTLTAEAITVVPGTVVVDIDRERGILYVHAMATRNEADIVRHRRDVISTEERIVLAIGTHEQAAEIRAERRERRAARAAARTATRSSGPTSTNGGSS